MSHPLIPRIGSARRRGAVETAAPLALRPDQGQGGGDPCAEAPAN